MPGNHSVSHLFTNCVHLAGHGLRDARPGPGQHGGRARRAGGHPQNTRPVHPGPWPIQPGAVTRHTFCPKKHLHKLPEPCPWNGSCLPWTPAPQLLSPQPARKRPARGLSKRSGASWRPLWSVQECVRMGKRSDSASALLDGTHMCMHTHVHTSTEMHSTHIHRHTTHMCTCMCIHKHMAHTCTRTAHNTPPNI